MSVCQEGAARYAGDGHGSCPTERAGGEPVTGRGWHGAETRVWPRSFSHHTHDAALADAAAAPPDMDDLRNPDTFTNANRPQNMPITPRESAVMHRHPYNRHERHCGGVVAQDRMKCKLCTTIDTRPAGSVSCRIGFCVLSGSCRIGFCFH